MANDKAGNSIADANRSAFRNLGTKPILFKDRIGGGDFDDFLQLRFRARSSLAVSLKGISTDLELQNRKGKVLQKANGGQIQTTLEAGKYYLRVSRDPKLRIGETEYTLKAAAYPDLAGNSLGTARPITVSSSQASYSDYVGDADLSDYYQFEQTEDGGLAVGLDSTKGATKVDVLDTNGDLVEKIVAKEARSSAGGYSGDGIFNLEAGDYYLRVTPKDSGFNTPYDLTLKSLEPADPAATQIQFAITNQTSQFRGTVKITGVVKNIGDSLFDSGSGQQSVLLYEIPLGGSPILRAQKNFEDLAPGQKLKLSYSRNWDASSPSEGEFPPNYRVVISYDPDIYIDGNPFNDDANLGNNQRDRSGSGINDLFTSP